jgi:hypothetical protein
MLYTGQLRQSYQRGNGHASRKIPCFGTEVMRPPNRNADERLDFFRQDIFFYGHIFEFTGFKDIAAFLALDEFLVFLTCHHAHAWMPADFGHIRGFGSSIRDWKWSDWIHIRLRRCLLRRLFTNTGYFYARIAACQVSFRSAPEAGMASLPLTMDESFSSRVAA